MIRDPNLPEMKREFAAAPSSWYLVCTVAIDQAVQAKDYVAADNMLGKMPYLKN